MQSKYYSVGESIGDASTTTFGGQPLSDVRTGGLQSVYLCRRSRGFLGMTYVVSVFETWYWQSVLATKDMAEALALAKEIGDKGRVERKPEPDTPWTGAARRTSCMSPANDRWAKA
ncbi:hypothetical protein AU467_17590 [Mesorhizobium loti]|uniref:Uncharacterized protein n=1 Tax=Rhizobium loti TaxID=381 RepID=A0A117N428_RHILI|nr:hypothetical protein AU467_17590 [Mesorhizobium loti]